MKIAVLMSGGVDSTVAAAWLKEQGHELLGLTMRHPEEDAVVAAARQAAAHLGIPHQTVDLRARFQQQVIDYFCEAYAVGCTPNPCVECNRSLKFGALLDLAREQGYMGVATGHYVRKEYDPASHCWRLKQAVDSGKDQSYFLWRLNQAQLAAACFPLGEWTKHQVKEWARERGILAAESPESQEICFISGDYRDFLTSRLNAAGGEITDRLGHVLGHHQGLAWYTVGQRKGLGISAGHPLYVLSLEPSLNRVVLGEEAELYHDTLRAEAVNIIAEEKGLAAGQRVETKIRYSRGRAPATLLRCGQDMLELRFDQPQRAITPGQSIVLYQGEYVLGGGVIVR